MSEYMSDGAPPPPTSLSVTAITNKILQMLQAGELAPANRFAQDQLAKGASSDGLDETAKKRWELTRELLEAAWEIPMPVTSALASGIDANNPATAVDALKTFAKGNAEGAAAADRVLATKAPGLHVYIPGALKASAAAPRPVAPRPAYYDYSPPPVYTSSSSGGGWRIWTVIGVITVAFIRCAAMSGSSSSYDSDYSYHPSYDYDFNSDKFNEDLKKRLDNLNLDVDKDTDHIWGSDSDSYTNDQPDIPTGPPEVPVLDTSADPEDLYDEIATSVSALYRVDFTGDKQQTYLENLDQAVVDRDCAKMKKYIGQLEYSKPGEQLDNAKLAKDHMKGIHKRIDLVCKKAKKPAAKKPAADDGVEGGVEGGTVGGSTGGGF